MFTEVLQAIAREKQIKRWSRVKKQALINKNWDSLNGLAECTNETSHKIYKPDDEKGCTDD